MVLIHTSRGDKGSWEKLPGHNRNEALDCRNYAMAGLKIINPDMDAVERRLKGLDETPKSKARGSPERRKKKNQTARERVFDDW